MMLMVQKEKVKMMKSNKTSTKSGKKILKKLYKLLDKLIVTPISSIVYKIQKRFGIMVTILEETIVYLLVMLILILLMVKQDGLISIKF